MNYSALTTLIALFLSAFSIPALCEDDFTNGIDYVQLDKPSLGLSNGLIEVYEFFSYSCGHCREADNVISGWAATRKDVDYKRIPAVWDTQTSIHAMIYHSMEGLGLIGTLHNKVFDEIHLKNNKMLTRDEVLTTIEGYGVLRSQFLAQVKSFRIASNIQLSGGSTREFEIRTLPTLVVDGRFKIQLTKKGGVKKMIRTADYLIQQVNAGHL
jgi:protein dithiol oxidoreductase (disulfide-forming)